MKSNYKKLGPYIREIDIRNTGLNNFPLLGVSVKKEFIASIANTIGTDFTKYKIVKRNQFTYIPDTSRRGEKIGLAMLEDIEEGLVSQAYTVFEVVDKNLLLPEYLMMWFRRPEFDRYARFKSHGSVREIFDWEEMCDVELPIPDITEQRAIVDEYHVIQDRIRLNETMISRLEDTAQALYREWFVDYEFPDDRGKPYKSSGGELEYSEELEKEVPKGWRAGKLEDIIENFDSKRKPISGDERSNKAKLYPYYGAAALMDYIDEYIFDGEYILLGEDGTVIQENGTPILQYVWGKFWVNNHAHVLKGKSGYNENLLYLLLRNTNIQDIITGGVQAKVNQGNLNGIKITKPEISILNNFKEIIDPIFLLFKNLKSENTYLGKMNDLILAKMASVE